VTRAFIGIGSNLGNRLAHLRAAVGGLPDVVRVSPLYETEALGGPEGQDPYLNAVVELDTELGARQLLELGQALEATEGRVRTERWGPRTLDVDVLLVGDEVADEDDLVVPHPRMWERRFVLAPLSDLAPELVEPELLEQAQGEVRKVGSFDAADFDAADFNTGDRGLPG